MKNPKLVKGIMIVAGVFIVVAIVCPPIAMTALVLLPAFMIVDLMKRGIARLFPEKYDEPTSGTNLTKQNGTNEKPTIKPAFLKNNAKSPMNYQI